MSLRQEIEPRSPAWQAGILATILSENSWRCIIAPVLYTCPIHNLFNFTHKVRYHHSLIPNLLASQSSLARHPIITFSSLTHSSIIRTPFRHSSSFKLSFHLSNNNDSNTTRKCQTTKYLLYYQPSYTQSMQHVIQTNTNGRFTTSNTSTTYTTNRKHSTCKT